MTVLDILVTDATRPPDMLPGLFFYVGEHRRLAIRRPTIGISVHAEVDGLNEASTP